jgi:hypothetical protein
MGWSRNAVRAAVFAAMLGVALVGVAAAMAAADKLEGREIVPGESIGKAALGMTKQQVKRALQSPRKPSASDDGHFQYLVYSYPYSENNPGGPLIVTMKEGSPHRVVALVTGDPRLSTRPDDIGVSSKFFEMLSAFPNANCYHRNSDGSRDENIEDSENFECEVKKNGGFTYFSYGSLDSDPKQHIVAVGVTAQKIP